MKYFIMPADFKTETLDKYDELNKNYNDSKVIETYGQISLGTFFESGRNILEVPKVDFDRLKSYVEYSRKKGIDFNYTFNASYMNNKEFSKEGIANITSFLTRLYEIGIDSLTIALPSVIELVGSLKLRFKIKASTICQINNASKAMYYKNMGVERIVVDESVHRDFETLKRIREAFGSKVEVIANTICHKHCIYRMFHYNEEAGDSFKVVNEASATYFINRCVMRKFDSLGNLLKISWIRPEDIKFYTGIGINYFKIQGRQFMEHGRDPVKAVKHYMEESYDGSFFELLDLFLNPDGNTHPRIENKLLDGFINVFVENPGFCKNDCGNCGYCDNFAKRFATDKVLKANESLKKLHQRRDAYTKMLALLTNEK
ncbi:MAG: U32 family peptidase [Firmicutes bacterium]|nr:U32 family peptidase [Bacillota bacterium]